MTMPRYIILIVFLLVTKHAMCDFKHSLLKRVEELKSKSIEMYGEVTEEVEFDDTLWYPRGDKQKLAKISKLWNEYYECSARLAVSLTPSRQLPSVMTMAYVGATARMHCSLCIAPDERMEVTWFYAESLKNLTFFPMEEKDRIVEEYDNISIYHVELEDAGIYRCQIGDSIGGIMVLEVVDSENYTVVKPLASQGPYPCPVQPISDFLTMFSFWSPWSECSVCGKVGRRRRYGICYIRFTDNSKNRTLNIKENNTTIAMNNQDRQGFLNDISIKLFEAFPEGIPCCSKYLPHSIRSIQAVQHRRNEIMIAMCKVPCKDKIFEVRSSSGEVLERVNNSAGIYSLEQRPPAQPPLPVRDIVFASYREPLVLPCPGTTLRDMPVTWRVGTRLVVPRHLDEGTRGRVHINARDHLVFATVLYPDANLYSCWQENKLAGAVKLVVWRGAQAHWNHHTTLLALVVGGGVVLRVAERVLRNKQRRLGLI